MAALSDSRAVILSQGTAGPSNPRNIGLEKCVRNLGQAIRGALKGKDKDSFIASVFVGLPALAEEFSCQKDKIKKNLLKQPGLTCLKKSRIEIGSDQLTAFRAGSREKDGLIIIAGTGQVGRGWRGPKEYSSSGWGWLADEGSGFWIGRQSLQAAFKDLDGRGKKTLISRLIAGKYPLPLKRNFSDKYKKPAPEDGLFQIYSENFVQIISSFSILTEQAARAGDKVARTILKQAGHELALSAITIIRQLRFQKEVFPLVLTGGVFRSEIVFRQFRQEIKKNAPRAKIIYLKRKPIKGAIKLAIEKG